MEPSHPLLTALDVFASIHDRIEQTAREVADELHGDDTTGTHSPLPNDGEGE